MKLFSIKKIFYFLLLPIMIILMILEFYCIVVPKKHVLNQLMAQEVFLLHLYKLNYQKSVNQKRFTKKIKVIDKLLFPTQDLISNKIVEQLLMLFKTNQLKLLQITPKKSHPKQTWHQLHFQIELIGKDQDFVRWLWLVTQQPWITDIQSFSLQNKNDYEYIQLNLLIDYD